VRSEATGGPSGIPSVPGLITARLRGEQDDYTLALSVEGGGMRGVVSGAMLLALRDLGLAGVFDRFYGTSSGSMNLAYFAAGSGWDALSVYYDHLASGFVRRRPFRLPRLDMAYVFDEVMRNRVPLDRAKAAASPYDIRIVLSDVETIRPVIVPIRTVADRLEDYLKAGAWLPMLAGPPHVLDGHRYLDGGLLWPDPMYAALDERVTHILMLNTAPEGAGNSTSPLAARVLHQVLNRWRAGLGDAYWAGRGPWAADRAAIGRSVNVSFRGAQVFRLCPPPGSHRVERLSVARDDLLDGARAGYLTVLDQFGPPPAGAYFAVVTGP
jgi:predicted patatin/cPLA2 family phospholipase